MLLRGGQVPKLRLSGELKPLETDPLDPDKFEEAVEQSLSQAQWRYYSQYGSIDMGLDLSDKTRFRINILQHADIARNAENGDTRVVGKLRMRAFKPPL